MHQPVTNPNGNNRMKSRNTPVVLIALGLAAGAASTTAQDTHLNAGANGTAQGDQLYFANGAAFVSSSGYKKQLTFASSGVYVGYYQGSLTLVALAQTVANGGPAANAPAPGSFIQYRIESVTGPAGAHFAFWEHDTTAPTYSLATGSTTPTSYIPLSDASLGAGTLGGDPYGHIHGRRFTADAPGDYTIGLKLYDTSANGAGGGPIHSASDTFFLSFQAVSGVPEPSMAALVAAGTAAIGFWLRRRSPAFGGKP